jgi:hypothetical protein
MAFITRGELKIKPKIKKFLALGPGESITSFVNSKIELDDSISVIAMHNVFPKITAIGNRVDYWTWGDPHAVGTALADYEKLKPGKRPKIIIPHWMMTLNEFTKSSGTTPMSRANGETKNTYHRVLESIKGTDELILIKNAVTTKSISKTHDIFQNPKNRFTGEFTYFNSAPFDAVHSGSNWTSENKFTSLILPICHYLGADEVYSLGFDNKGRGINPTRTGTAPFNDKIKGKYNLWTKVWQPYHNMKIYNLSPPKYSPNHTFMETVLLSELYKK